MLKSKKIMIVVVTIIAMLMFLGMISMEVYASDNPINLDISGIGGSTADDANAITANQIVANQIAANQIAANQQAANSTVLQPTTNTNNGNTLPQTGVTEDITVMFFIIVCAISAIYAYKKIRDYKA